MSENMMVIAALSRLAAESGQSYGKWVALQNGAELRRRVRGIRSSLRQKRGGRYYRVAAGGERI